ncbi:DNA replication licensing factor Mcm5 [Condylostylus longicornis]|uniref:DNA replication licensing factor Mcm5 n=1 Tax=Condylostylus longicornis TaxID=2530218 RepID=UPI00244DE74D|nr:DNA replication licensing factor Mcm5 [Condylostylus longicornis]XP_055386105.1 DNA replication licensing factor Mcm5 [Condylostylus longicornis]
MEGFDDVGVFFSDNFGGVEQQDGTGINMQVVKNKYKEFIRTFNEENFYYKYRDTLKRNYLQRKYFLEVEMEDLAGFDETLADKLYKQPTEHLKIFEEAAREVADEITAPRGEHEEHVEDIQILLTSNANPTNIRELKSECVSKLVKIAGIIISASAIKAKATKISIQCRSCSNVIPNLSVNPGLEGYALPRKCNTEQAGKPNCPLDPYFIMPDKCKCVDFQILKLQELPDFVPQGEIARHLQLFCDRSLCERVVPGNRVLIHGIYSIRKVGRPSRQESREKASVGVRAPYMRIVGITVDTEGVGAISRYSNITLEEEETFRRMAASGNIYERLAKNLAPSIFGSEDIKKAITCLLFGGSRKRLPDGLCRRGDINVLLLGDPGTAKSQLLKFVEKVAPIAVYTSGKGSSAAGLTASVMRDPSSRNFVMEGGAMVLADGGVVCIDEFDKMREDDRVAIHEAMEQQTISIAKAGITTTLNSRCSVLAAANSIFGRWDETKGEENIDFMPTILSRFDMIFIVKDIHDESRDVTLAKHIINVHLVKNNAAEDREGDIPLSLFKKYIHFCRINCGPRLSIEAGEKLKSRYVLMRSGAGQQEKSSEKKLSIPITVRQLEAVIRITESLAKMELQPFANDKHVNEALRLFQVSTLDAATSGTLTGAEGFTTEEDQDILNRIEKQLKRRFAIGSQVSEQNIIQDFLRQKYTERAVLKVIYTMIRRGELQHRMQRKMLYRLR